MAISCSCFGDDKLDRSKIYSVTPMQSDCCCSYEAAALATLCSTQICGQEKAMTSVPLLLKKPRFCLLIYLIYIFCFGVLFTKRFTINSIRSPKDSIPSAFKFSSVSKTSLQNETRSLTSTLNSCQ